MNGANLPVFLLEVSGGGGLIMYVSYIFKGIDHCPIEIIKGLTDKGQFNISQN